MIRTQISLDAKEYALARREAKALGISVAEFVRRAIRDQLPSNGGQASGAASGAWMRYAGFIESGNPRSSASVDEIVYGAKD
jgi:Ribbon-helix-helix protein, copG family